MLGYLVADARPPRRSHLRAAGPKNSKFLVKNNKLPIRNIKFQTKNMFFICFYLILYDFYMLLYAFYMYFLHLSCIFPRPSPAIALEVLLLWKAQGPSARVRRRVGHVIFMRFPPIDAQNDPVGSSPPLGKYRKIDCTVLWYNMIMKINSFRSFTVLTSYFTMRIVSGMYFSCGFHP